MKRQPTPQHITWILDLFRNKQLDLDPPYQRKSVWSPKDRRFFLDTIFRNYPTPPIFVHRTVDENGFSVYHVVDGKQRLETILAFAQNEIAVDKGFGDENLNGKKFRDLLPEYKRKFWDYVLVVDFVESIVGTNIEEVFDRVNRNSKNLQPQELRHARFDGWFITEVETEGEDQFWWNIKVSTRAKEKRMKNIQFISELLLINLEKKIVGFDQDYLDQMYAFYDVPEDIQELFDKDAYIESKNRSKDIIKSMNSINRCIDLYCKTANNLYTLWALISLNETLPEVGELANKYTSFMSKVQEFIDAETPEEQNPELNEQQHFNYYINSKGASTDFTPRNQRLQALSTILIQ